MSFLLIFFYCGTGPSPRVVVMDFIEAVNKADTASIEKYLDIEGYAQEKAKELPEVERQQISPKFKEHLKADFLGSGLTRLLWQSKMIVVNKEDISGNSAVVEVTFIDKETGITQYTNAKLHKINKRWMIYYIKD
jgi:hypothetical protein